MHAHIPSSQASINRINNYRPPSPHQQNRHRNTDIRFHNGPPLLVNDDCVDSRLNRPGICRLASECVSVQQEFKQNRRNPTICSYQDNDLVVCCPLDAGAAVRPAQPARTTQPPDQPPTFSWSEPARPNRVNTNSLPSSAPPKNNVLFGEPPSRKSQESRFH